MNTLINGMNRGLGFAIYSPLNMAKDIGGELIVGRKRATLAGHSDRNARR